MFRIPSATFVLWVCLRGTALADVLYTIEELLPLPGYTIAHAFAINDSGQVVGYSVLPEHGGPPGEFDTFVSAVLWDQSGVALNISPFIASNTGYIALDINNSGQIVGQVTGCQFGCSFVSGNGVIGPFVGSGNWATVAPGSLASVPTLLPGVPQCHQDDSLTGISDTGYMTSLAGGISSPNMSTDLCGLDVSVLYESGLMLTDIGYVYDPIVDSARQWVVVPSCSGDVTGYALSGNSFGFTPPVPSLEVSDQVAQSICDLITGPIHDKVINESGQFILNVGNQAFLYTPCSPFPGGGSTEGCFPGPGAFPAPEPTTLALLAMALAGLGISRRKRKTAPLERRKGDSGMKNFFLALAGFALLVSAPVRGDILTAEAVLSHSDLSVVQPISFSVDFGVTFSSVQTVNIDAFWVADGFGPAEGITYSGLGGYDQLQNTVLFRALTFNDQLHPSIMTEFLDGTFSGTIETSSSFPTTTVTYDRLFFVIDGTVASVPEPASFILLLAGLLGLLFWVRRPRLLKGRK